MAEPSLGSTGSLLIWQPAGRRYRQQRRRSWVRERRQRRHGRGRQRSARTARRVWAVRRENPSTRLASTVTSPWMSMTYSDCWARLEGRAEGSGS
eukprot:COSAG03_NODE_1634_length_3739_cov_17.806868_3_plen_95_part_00